MGKFTKEVLEHYEEKGPIATFCDSNWGGVEIFDILYGTNDYVVARYNYGEPQQMRCVKIRHGVNHSSFRLGRRTYRLDECLRVG